MREISKNLKSYYEFSGCSISNVARYFYCTERRSPACQSSMSDDAKEAVGCRGATIRDKARGLLGCPCRRARQSPHHSHHALARLAFCWSWELSRRAHVRRSRKIARYCRVLYCGVGATITCKWPRRATERNTRGTLLCPSFLGLKCTVSISKGQSDEPYERSRQAHSDQIHVLLGH